VISLREKTPQQSASSSTSETLGNATTRRVTLQQIQKYEQGKNRITAGRLIQFAERLGVSPAYFVNGFGEGSKGKDDATKTARALDSIAASKEGVAVLEAMAQMGPGRRKFMVTLARTLRDME
jgi:transcriptional regulator with XRE-family HTH domain